MTALDLLLPPSCSGCGRHGTPCCATCLDAFGPPVRLQVPGVGPPVWALAAYHGVARELVLAFKERGARALVAWFGALVAAALVAVGPAPWTLIPAPSRRNAARSRGGDHMVRIARAVEIAAASGASLTILSAGRPDKARAVAEGEAARHAGSGVQVDTRAVEGDPVDALVATAADGGYDLLVVGNRGMTGVTRFLRNIALPVATLVLWELLGRSDHLPDFLSTPSGIAAAFAEVLGSGELEGHVWVSMVRAFAGFAIGASLGVVMGLASGVWTPLRNFFDAPVSLLYPVPKIAFPAASGRARSAATGRHFSVRRATANRPK